MQSLLKIVTECIDRFSEKINTQRLAAIIGGEAVILHGIPRTTLDLDIILFFGDEEHPVTDICGKFALFLRQELEEHFEVRKFKAARDPSDPIKHDLIIITDSKNRFKRLDILIANYKWELEGFYTMNSPNKGELRPYSKVHLAGMKLMAGGVQDDEDIRNLFLIMSEPEKKKTFELAHLIRRDKNLADILEKYRHKLTD
ncbi:MAG: hypothetical protein GY795_07600 [Desulfobacterales bacterium]|nr:hypothetical protein [Desulfobacterales bacterium]